MGKRHHEGASAARAIARIEERLVAASGLDPFDLVLARLNRLARKIRGAAALPDLRNSVEVGRALAGASKTTRALVDEVDRLLERAFVRGGDETIDTVFEALSSRVGKGEKGQFFTPAAVVRFVCEAVAIAPAERMIDPACGSGAFVAEAARRGADASGVDIDARAVRLAKLRLLLLGKAFAAAPAEQASRRAGRIVCADGLGPRRVLPRGGRGFHLVLANPPFAGAAPTAGFAVASLAPRAERDLLFLERSLDLLRPGGTLGIVLPHGKLVGAAWSRVRKLVHERARIVAVVSLPRETFLPHTSQRTAALFAAKRYAGERAREDETVLLAVSERACRDSAGEPRGEHDLGELADVVRRRIIDARR